MAAPIGAEASTTDPSFVAAAIPIAVATGAASITGAAESTVVWPPNGDGTGPARSWPLARGSRERSSGRGAAIARWGRPP
jgi:hypothetical protein